MADPTQPSALLGETPADGPAPRLAPGRVGVVLVSHDGARWLPTVLDGLAAQRIAPARVVAVDTGSRDESRDLLDAHAGVDTVVPLTSGTTYPAAVAAGLAALTEAGADPAGDTADGAPEWLWLLHDDSTPAPDALEQLLYAAGADPGADLLGPKLREWPSLRRLLEVGVTISGTGRRESGLERGEYDQGQHDHQHEVLAVHTAGLLVRREAFEALGGLDEQLGVFGNDLDLGWRAAATGRRTVVVPAAVVFHAEAAHRGLRRTPLTGRHTHYAERRAALYTLLVNASARSLPFRVLRLSLGTLLRMLGFLLVRSPGEALDDLAALVAVVGRPGAVRAGRRRRRELVAVGPDRSRALLAPAWLPYRHGLDLVGDLVSAATMQASDVAERRREERAAELAERTGTGRRNRHVAADLGAETEPDPLDDDAAPERGLLGRLLTDPRVLAVVALLVAAAVATREAWGPVAGGALDPAPAGAGAWWALHLEAWHPLGVAGSEVPAPPYVAVLAVLGGLLLGSAQAAVTTVLVLAVPVALAGAWRFLRVAARLADPRGAPPWLLATGAAAYALVPLTSGAVGQGRLGVVVLAALLPWAAHAALGFLEPEPDRRRRAGWRCGLLLAVITAFVPATWVLAAALAAVALVVGFVLSPRGMRVRSAWVPPVVTLLVPVVLLAPWLVGVLAGATTAGVPAALLLEAGAPPSAVPGWADLLTGRLGGTGPDGVWWWLGVVPAALAVLALLVARTRGAVVTCWVVALVAVVAGGAAGLLRLDLAAVDTPVGTAAVVVVLAAAAVTAAVLGACGLPRPARGTGRAAGLVALALAVVAVGGAAWSVVDGSGDLRSDASDGIPAYMTSRALDDPANGVLVVTGDVETGLRYTVRRGDGTTVGEAEVQQLTPEDTDASATVAALLAQPDEDAVAGLSGLGVRYVVLPAPADGRVAAGLDAVDGLAQASAEDRSTRAWQVEAGPSPDAVRAPDDRPRWLHAALLVLQGLALLVVAVLCGPSRGRTR